VALNSGLQFDTYIMANNDQIILDQVLEQQKNDRAPHLSDSSFFEVFVGEQILKDYDLSDEQIESGIVGSGSDGGIDCIYVFCNGDLAREDFDYSLHRKAVSIEIYIIQTKISASYGEEPLNKLIAVTGDLFNLAHRLEDYRAVYNESVLASVGIFRNVFNSLASRFPSLTFNYIYASKGDSSQIHPNVARKAELLKNNISSLFSAGSFEFRFVGSADLLTIARRQPITIFQLNVAETISAPGGYIALVPLREFDLFVRDERGLRKNLFESNVRDYQGASRVNEEIQKTLVNKGIEDFWWLNNGITIVASKAVQSGKTLTIEDPQIVNGLQTTNEICEYFQNRKANEENRHVMVRVVVTEVAESRDRIIKATNSQTVIPSASLRATDKVHRDIEEFIRPFGYFYDRRKNFHKNEGKSTDQIISIPLMAQAIMAIALQRPADARARPSTLINKDEDYLKLFNVNHPIEIYLISCTLIKRTQSYLRTCDKLALKDRNNLLFYIGMHVAACLTKKSEPTLKDLAAINISQIDEIALLESLSAVHPHYLSLGATDQAAKGTTLLPLIKEDLKKKFPKIPDQPLFNLFTNS
jgi:hypothetical protein